MLVVSLPRSGATKYCMDLSEQTGLPFVGDMNPGNIVEYGAWWAKIKQNAHETKHDQSISISDYLDVLHNREKYVILANTGNHLLLPMADKIILRRNVVNTFRSICNYWLKMAPEMNVKTLLDLTVNPMVAHSKLLYKYVQNNASNVVWYEDYFDNFPCNTSALDQHLDKDVIYNHIYMQLGDLCELQGI